MNLQEKKDINLAVAPGFLRRLGAMFYDALLLLALMAVATTLITLPFGMPTGPARHLFQGFLFGVIPIGFFTGFWTYGGQTAGMRAWGFKVVSVTGEPLRWTDALRRCLYALLSWLLLGLGYLWMLLDRDRLTLHDRLSATRLIRL